MNCQTTKYEGNSDLCEGRWQGELQARDGLESRRERSDAQFLAPASVRKLSMGSVNWRRVVGVGSTSVVQLAEEKSSGLAMAVKVINKSSLQKVKNIERLHSEKSIVSSLRHPFIVDFYGTFQDPERLYLALEYVPGGELYSYLCKQGVLSKAEAKFYVAEVASALVYLHSQGVAYRDLKPENLLLAASGHIKLTDFGYAKRLKPGERTFSLCGTPHCMAPEVVSRSGHDSRSDWWALGILLYEMLTGCTPFDADSAYDMYANILTKDFRAPKEADEATAHLLHGLLTKDPSARLTGVDVLHHEFFGDIAWQELPNTRPCYVPKVKSALDDSYFDQYPEQPTTCGSVPDQSVFEGY